MKTTQFLGTCLAISFCASAYAQSRVEQSQQFQRRQEITAPALRLDSSTEMAPELYPGENKDVGPQRLLQMKPRRSLFDLVVDSQYVWSDNVTLANNNTEESAVFINTLQVAFAPKDLTWNDRQIEPRIGLRNQWYNYGLTPGGNDRFLGSLDFEAQTLFAETRYRFADEWYVSGGVEAQQLVDQGDYGDDFYRDLSPFVSVQWYRSLADNKVITALYRGSYHFTDTESFFLPGDQNNRTDHSITISYIQEVLPKFVVQPFYRFQYTYYTEFNERHDMLHDMGISAAYHFTRWASLRTFVGYQIKDAESKSFLPDYEKLDLGIGGTLVFEF